MGFSRFVFLCIPLLAFLSTCQIATPTPTEQVIATDTLAPPTAATQPTATVLPTATPYVPLSPEGPYLLYMVTGDTWDETFLYLMDMEGFGRKRITLPENSRVFRPLEESISPDGRWLAFHTLGNGSPWHMNLHLFNLETEEHKLIAPLLSQDFPENQEEVADAMIELGVREEARGFIEFGSSINHSLSWSPDGNYLAFAAQIDGPSTDIYIYDIESEEVFRLTNEPFNIWTLNWSPDSQWVMYQGIVMDVIYQGSTLEAINISTGQVRKFIGIDNAFFWRGVEWVSESEYLTSGAPDGGDPHNLRIANVSTGQLTTLWGETYLSYAVDKENQVLAIFGAPDEIQVEGENNYLEVGYYLVSFDGKRNILSPEGSWTNYFRGGESTRFVGLFPDGVRGFSLDGSDKLISESNESLHVSPDYRWVIVGTQDGFELFDKNDQLVRTFSGISISEGFLREIIWRPDGQGFFVRYIENIYYISLPDGEPILIEDCQDRDCWLPQWDDYSWLP